MKKPFRVFIQCIIIAPLFFTGLPSPAAAQQVATYAGQQQGEYTARINQGRHWIDSLRQEQNIPGVQVAVWVDGDVVWSEGFGYADVEQRDR